jgi:tetratricopeptide (TPR) repeat protein
MVEFSKPEAYLRQIAVYLKGQMNQQAYNLSQDFVKNFPGELLSHVLLAETAFRLGKFQESKVEAQKALKLAQSESDIRFCALVFSTACFQLKDYIEGYNTLKLAMKGRFLPEVEEALLILSLAMADEQKAMHHMKNLMVLNRERAMEFMKAYAANLEAVAAR